MAIGIGKHLVLELAEALNRHDRIAARECVAEDMRFIGVFGPPLEGADAYLDAMLRLGARQEVVKCIAEQDDVVCFYELGLPSRPDVQLWGAGWFSIKNGRIASIRVVFDPIPLSKGQK